MRTLAVLAWVAPSRSIQESDLREFLRWSKRRTRDPMQACPATSINAERKMAYHISTVEDLLERSASNRSNATKIDQRFHLALELIADALIAVLAELKETGTADVTSIPSM